MQLWIKIILLELPRALSYTHPHTQVLSVSWMVQPCSWDYKTWVWSRKLLDFSRPQYLFLKDLAGWYLPQRVAVTPKGNNVKSSLVILPRDEAPAPTFFRSPLQCTLFKIPPPGQLLPLLHFHSTLLVLLSFDNYVSDIIVTILLSPFGPWAPLGYGMAWCNPSLLLHSRGHEEARMSIRIS